MKKILKGYSMRVQNIQEVKAKNDLILFGRTEMSWTTIYITGKSDFRDDVRRKLEHSDQRYMPGFVENTNAETPTDLYWLDGRTELRAFKEAIGGKLIWKHRLHFYNTLEAFLAAQEAKAETEFSARERQMIAAMQAIS